MITKTRSLPPANPAAAPEGMSCLMRVYAEARRYLAYRERAKMLMNVAPGDLADAIDRDFIVFDLARAERRLREALRSAEPLMAECGLPLFDEED